MGALKADNGDIENDKYQAGTLWWWGPVTRPPGEPGEWGRARGEKGGGGGGRMLGVINYICQQ